MPRMTELWPSQWRRKKRSRTVYVGSHEHKLSRIPAMHIDPDDDARTREDVEGEKPAPPTRMGPAGMM